MQGISPHPHPLEFPSCSHTCSQFTCCLKCSFKKQWMAEQCHEQSNPFQVECHCLIFSLRLKTANLHSVKVKIQPKYAKFGDYTKTQHRGTDVLGCIWVGMADGTITSTCIHHNGHLICVQAPVVGEINIFPLILFYSACGNLTCQSKIRKYRIFCQPY